MATLLPAVAAAALLAGTIALLTGERDAARGIWLSALVVTGVPAVARTIRRSFTASFATDLVAILAIIGALLLREPAAGLVIVLMLTGGEWLERLAGRRASFALRELERSAPQMARRRINGHVENISAELVRPGDTLLVRPGELMPADCIVLEGSSYVDASKLTGEPIPIAAGPGTRLMSASVNGDGSLIVRAEATAQRSQYARIVELVRTAQASKAPLQRIADRYAVWFTPFTLLVCALTYAATRDWTRVLAVLVVATPCPLILATPVAILGGINRAARLRIIVRSGAALETLSRVTAAVFDKTGTLTAGQPSVASVSLLNGYDENQLLRLTGAVEQHSSHRLGRVVADAARQAAGALPDAIDVLESPGRGIRARVEGREVAVGGREYAQGMLADCVTIPESQAGLRAYAVVDGRLAGAIEFADQLRPGLSGLFQSLRDIGIRRTMLLSGDHAPNVHAVATTLGLAEARGNLLPGDKVAAVEELEREGHVVMMVGDGTNDAPALGRAHVGIALAAAGGGIATESADVILVEDDPRRVADALAIGKRTMRIARESIWAGLGLSGLAMLAAALGYIPPIAGAALQEVIDVAVIGNALRASR